MERSLDAPDYHDLLALDTMVPFALHLVAEAMQARLTELRIRRDQQQVTIS